MTNTDIIYRPACESDIFQMVDLMNMEYKRKKNKQYFMWQYLNAHIPSVSFCAFYKGKLIGISGIQKKELTNGLILGQAIDSIMLPEWRGKGIFQKLCSTALNYFTDLDALFAFTNPGTNAYVKYFNWKKVYKINSFILTINKFKNIIPPTYSERFNSINYRFKYFELYRNWRFHLNPVYTYHYVHLNNNVFSIVKLFNDPSTQKTYGDIVDFNCNIYNAIELTNLLSESCNKLFQMGCEFITTWSLPNMLLSLILKDIGFIEDPQERYLILNVINEKEKDMYDINNWHLVQADAEIF